jgi:serine/threonine protein kinase
MNIKNIGKYNYNTEYIGKGSFSKVYIGFDNDNNKYAIKKIYKKNDEKYINLVEKEIEIMEKLNHINIVKLYDKIYTEKHIFLIMELCDSDLNKYITEKELTEKDIKEIMKQIIEVLKYIMDNNIVHRDLKPHNILINNDKKIKLADFGFAREFKETLISETICGSPLYMAPEILNHENYNIKSDLWSLGIILYQMIMKDYPYKAKNVKELINLINNNKPIILNKNINSKCKTLIEDLLKLDYKERLDWNDLYKNEWIYDIKESELDLEKECLNNELGDESEYFFSLGSLEETNKKNNKLKKNIKSFIKREDSFDYCFDNSIVMDNETFLEYKKQTYTSSIVNEGLLDINLKKLIIDNYIK